ncbi:nitrate reductase molybdenum cofactor assembly chaperone [Streptosporangium roseum]|uniref:Nitrate reductase delta subunit protein n=1 Tax=Streptosporangium roseum (strain ATCC 12428 / DSM 43021 / JCM 3005 / KCTC 9067 / NCIMB 10171 / NRRL 2505 / NI 9100) TaxID=479432 RepID=D2AUP8_STRRD|nr:nitrate reductase molybdenum cofactor assembly chaperone [Streptosporangium roseum]ACZ84910.1 nitrate reductase delta subunit protein [Streptosporangium roseum DSM 43021]
MSGRPPGPGTDRVVWQAAAHLLAYPEEAFWVRLPLIREAAGARFGPFLDHLARADRGELAAHYVETFDFRRRCCLYLTYYADGDTRRRGESLAALKARYRAGGWELCGDELPDYLPVVLEFAALDPEGAAILRENRAGLELLRLALHECASPYGSVINAVCATLPPISGAERALVTRLSGQGPPAESVGVYG